MKMCLTILVRIHYASSGLMKQIITYLFYLLSFILYSSYNFEKFSEKNQTYNTNANILLFSIYFYFISSYNCYFSFKYIHSFIFSNSHYLFQALLTFNYVHNSNKHHLQILPYKEKRILNIQDSIHLFLCI